MANVFPGRYTATTDQPFVVFLIRFRINKLFAFRKWLPVANAMPPMIAELKQHPEKGLLDAFVWMGWRQLMLTQYWRSFEELEHFARSKDDPHLAAWRKFNQLIGADGSVGIWHETYVVDPTQYETMYANMPRIGLASATNHVPVIGRSETARRRMGGESEPAVPSPESAR